MLASILAAILSARSFWGERYASFAPSSGGRFRYEQAVSLVSDTRDRGGKNLMGWQPLLDGVSKNRALESVQAIVNDLARIGQNSADPSLAGGTAGLALMHAYCGLAKGGHECTTAAKRCVADAAVSMAEKPASPS